MNLRRINDRVSVAPQIAPEELADARAQGFVAIVNNRPDGEEPGQPSDAAMRAAAEAAGLSYAAIPVTQAGFSHPQIDAMADVLAGADGPVLAFCRSGTRSCNLWALAEAKRGETPDALVAAGAEAGLRPAWPAPVARGAVGPGLGRIAGDVVAAARGLGRGDPGAGRRRSAVGVGAEAGAGPTMPLPSPRRKP